MRHIQYKRCAKGILLAAAFALGVITSGCGDDGGSNNADAAPNTEDAAVFVCDPVGANPEMGGLLNATLESDVEVIVKQPNHPGDPGPTNLP